MCAPQSSRLLNMRAWVLDPGSPECEPRSWCWKLCGPGQAIVLLPTLIASVELGRYSALTVVWKIKMKNVNICKMTSAKLGTQ